MSSGDAPSHAEVIARQRRLAHNDCAAASPVRATRRTGYASGSVAKVEAARDAARGIYGCCGTAGRTPAIVVIAPSGVSSRIRWLPVSAM
jgi:hypothetical protein